MASSGRRGEGPLMAQRRATADSASEYQMVVVTPTYAPDVELFSDLPRSVLQWFPPDVRHVVVVNESDLPLFHQFEGPQCVVLGVRDVLPRSVVALPLSKLWLNVRRPVPPLR